MAATKPSKYFFAQSFPAISSESTEHMCQELAFEISTCSGGTGTPVALNDSETMVLPTELSTTNQTTPTEGRVQVDLLRD